MNCILVFLCLMGTNSNMADESHDAPYISVLGVAQDAGFPQSGCQKACCQLVHAGKVKPQQATCLALVDPATGQKWMFEATPSFPSQLFAMNQMPPAKPGALPAGIFLTHGHMGHYTGLMFLGREVMGAKQVPVYAMPRMLQYLSKNGPWDQLVRLKNIDLKPLKADTTVTLTPRLKVTPFLVPHRDEYTETVGYLVTGPQRKLAFIPDIDKWERWQTPIEDVIRKVDIAYLDATFFHADENPGRNMAEIPHPFVAESIARFEALAATEKEKVRFIHFNHTNPILRPGSEAQMTVEAAGMHVAEVGEKISL